MTVIGWGFRVRDAVRQVESQAPSPADPARREERPPARDRSPLVGLPGDPLLREPLVERPHELRPVGDPDDRMGVFVAVDAAPVEKTHDRECVPTKETSEVVAESLWLAIGAGTDMKEEKLSLASEERDDLRRKPLVLRKDSPRLLPPG